MIQKILTVGTGAILGLLALGLLSGIVEARPKEAHYARSYVLCLALTDGEKLFEGVMTGADVPPEQVPSCSFTGGQLVATLGATIHSGRDQDGDVMYLIEALPQAEGYGVAYIITWEHLMYDAGGQPIVPETRPDEEGS